MEFPIDYLRFAAALVAVIALIGLLAWIARRLGLGGASTARVGRSRRLGLVETASLDAKVRLVLVRRDDVEHLILLAPDGARVVERAIQRASPPPDPAGARTEPSP
jgi:flagellar protein FliO/FliZ